MTDYSNQNITGLNLSGVNLTGANFTNTNATNVNFTNAIITNATFKNTLITGATLTGITFSNLQKGQLLLRAANLSNTAINNLTSLTSSELRTIQPAISLRSLNAIQTITVAVPNNAGQGYNVAVTPNITQMVCIFVATNQNIVVTTSGTTVKTIRNNGTVIQDVDSLNVTISHLIIGSVPYRLSAGDGDGVIALIPIDLNQYKVNESGIGDIMSLNGNFMNWDNDVLRTGNTVTNSISPTLAVSLDVNNFVHEVIIEFYVDKSPGYIGLGFNEVYSDVQYIARSIIHAHGVEYDNGVNSTNKTLGFNTAMVIIPDSGECKLRFLLSPHRTFRNSGQGSSVQNLGVIAQGEFIYMQRAIDNTSNPSKLSTISFSKYALGTPLIDVTQPTNLLSNINYISIWCSSNIVAISNYRIRTRRYAKIHRN